MLQTSSDLREIYMTYNSWVFSSATKWTQEVIFYPFTQCPIILHIQSRVNRPPVATPRLPLPRCVRGVRARLLLLAALIDFVF